jgi:hypothetical protein
LPVAGSNPACPFASQKEIVISDKKGQTVITLKQARDNLQGVLDQLRLTRQEWETLNMSLELLYDGAREREEDAAEAA